MRESFSEILADVEADEQVESHLLLSFPGLVEGNYTLTLSLFQKDSLGNSIILDTIERACSFRIANDDAGDQALNWPARAWGSIHFPLINKR